jgi:hypothetical protein
MAPFRSIQFHRPIGLAMDQNESIIVAETLSNTIRRVSISENRVKTIAGNVLAGHIDGIAAKARFKYPTYIVLDKITGNIYDADKNCVFRQIDTRSGNVSTFVGDGRAGWVDDIGSKARFFGPRGMAIVNGSMFVGEVFNRKSKSRTDQLLRLSVIACSATSSRTIEISSGAIKLIFFTYGILTSIGFGLLALKAM